MAPNNQKPAGKKKRRGFSFSRLLGVSMVAALLAIILGLGGYLFIIINGQKQLRENESKLNMNQSSILYDANQKEFTKLFVQNRELVEFKDIPPKVYNAFVATEDKRFWEHQGVDYFSIGRALVKDVVLRSKAEGASTITQQLARGLFLNADKTFFRKATEMSIALALEKQYSKEEILTKYLNQVNFGSGAYGIKTAAKKYFNVDDLNKLETWQIATLAAIPKSPTNYSPINEPEKSKERRGVVLQLMADQGLITQEQKTQAAAVDYKAPPSQPTDQKQYLTFIDYVTKEAADQYGIDEDQLLRGGYKVYTTMNTTAQQTLEAAYANDNLFQKNMNDQMMQSSMVIVNNKDGGIVGMIGGRDYQRKGINRALVPRQPGSAFKPLVVYAPAIESGKYTPNSMLEDKETDFKGYKPKNYDGVYRGQVDLTTAVKKSINLPAVWLLNQIGLKTGKAFASNLGIPFDAQDNNLALALGGMTYGVTPLQLAQAYSAFPNNGVLNPAHAIVSIKDADGKDVPNLKAAKAKKVMSPKTAYYMTKVMESVVAPDGTGARAAMNRPVAGKTGSTQVDVKGLEKYNRDLWFAGYTPEWTAAVWMGFDKSTKDSPTYITMSSGSAAAIFKEVLQKALANVPVTDFQRPDGVPELTKPDAVTDLSAVYEPDNNRVHLTWTSPADNLTYQVFRKEAKETDFTQIQELKNTNELFDLSVQPGSVYEYYVIPLNPETSLTGSESNIAQVQIAGQPSPSPSLSPTPSASATASPSPSPTNVPGNSPAPGAGASGSPQPTASGSPGKTQPSQAPTASPSPAPSEKTGDNGGAKPSPSPSAAGNG